MQAERTSRSNRGPFAVAVVAVIALWLFDAQAVFAQFPAAGLPAPMGGIHRIQTVDSLPGAVGQARLQRWGFVAGYFQPVAFRGPESTQFSLADGGAFLPPSEPGEPLHAGLLIGSVYRFKVTSIPGREGEELFPTVEVIDRTYPPHHLAAKYPIAINLELADLLDALAGRMVTRVIYLEDPDSAIPLGMTPESAPTLDISAHEDPLHTADMLGKPVAIVRIGSLAPPTQESLLPQFFFGYPQWMPMQVPPEFFDPAGEPQPQAAVSPARFPSAH